VRKPGGQPEQAAGVLSKSCGTFTDRLGTVLMLNDVVLPHVQEYFARYLFSLRRSRG